MIFSPDCIITVFPGIVVHSLIKDIKPFDDFIKGLVQIPIKKRMEIILPKPMLLKKSGQLPFYSIMLCCIVNKITAKGHC